VCGVRANRINTDDGGWCMPATVGEYEKRVHFGRYNTLTSSRTVDTRRRDLYTAGIQRIRRENGMCTCRPVLLLFGTRVAHSPSCRALVGPSAVGVGHVRSRVYISRIYAPGTVFANSLLRRASYGRSSNIIQPVCRATKKCPPPTKVRNGCRSYYWL